MRYRNKFVAKGQENKKIKRLGDYKPCKICRGRSIFSESKDSSVRTIPATKNCRKPVEEQKPTNSGPKSRCKAEYNNGNAEHHHGYLKKITEESNSNDNKTDLVRDELHSNRERDDKLMKSSSSSIQPYSS